MIADVDERIAKLPPTSDPACKAIEDAIRRTRPKWYSYLTVAQGELEAVITGRRFHLVTGIVRQEVLRGERPLLHHEVAVSARLKTVDAILGKMQRFDEPLFNMLDIWGYRIIVSNTESLDDALSAVAGIWTTPTEEELALRNGKLRFPWLRDYRIRSHEGLSPATSKRYDEAVHVNRRAPFGVVEVQVMTEDLYRRAYVGQGEEAHTSFVRRRRAADVHRHKGPA